MKKCPYCGEQIKDEAVKCKHCKEWIEKPPLKGVQESHYQPTPQKPIMQTSSYDSTRTVRTVFYAGFWRRVMASLIDSIVWIVFFVIFVFVYYGLFLGVFLESVNRIQDSPFIELFASIALWLYSAIMESSEKQATLGKMALGIVVTDLEGNRISFVRATGRYFAKILSTLILCIGYMMAGFTKKKQALHDMIAGTLVVLKQ